MILPVQDRLRAHVARLLTTLYSLDESSATPPIALEYPPNRELGDLGTPVAFELARRLRKAPRAIAQEIAGAFGSLDGIRQVTAAPNGYLNFFLERRDFLLTRLSPETAAPRPSAGKAIVEHTAINPNKAAHIGHLRNSALGDTLVRVLRFRGIPVEVQNYIDDTGVQVADVVVGFRAIEGKTLEEIHKIADTTQFDYYCWDLYARVTEWYGQDKERLAVRGETLHDIEHGGNENAEIAAFIADRVVRCHLKTMARMNVDYDLLTWEGDILRLRFWAQAFEVLKAKGAVYLQTEGRLAGCWVMPIQDDVEAMPKEDEDEGEEREKVIVRSNGVVTYVGKDIAYQFWKLGLLGKDFHYRVFMTRPHGPLWATCTTGGEGNHPEFGGAAYVYNVIDVRQSYLQNVVKQGLLGLGYEEEARRSIHFSYEVVALTPACAEQLGVTLSEEDRKRAHIEVSGRKGQGVKADDLLDLLEKEARREVAQRNPALKPTETETIARQIAVGALRYFLLKYTRTAIIAFDFKEALNFDGETGPYIQYAAVRANNIIHKVRETDPSFDFARVHQMLNDPKLGDFLNEAHDIWELLYTGLRLDEIGNQVIAALEPASLAKYAFTLAQRFNLFYHRYRIVTEEDPVRRMFYILVVDLTREALTKSLDLMGIEVPRRM